MTDAELLSAAIKASGLSVVKFAKLELVRAPRQVWRWLAGDYPLPPVVRAKCAEVIQDAKIARGSAC